MTNGNPQVFRVYILELAKNYEQILKPVNMSEKLDTASSTPLFNRQIVEIKVGIVGGNFAAGSVFRWAPEDMLVLRDG